jgi:hypothetical protein
MPERTRTMTKAMMITNRNVEDNQLGTDRDQLRFYTSDNANPDSLDGCTERERTSFETT